MAPERRTRLDLTIAAALICAVLVAAALVWWNSDARGTTSVTDPGTHAPVAPADSQTPFPTTLSELWNAPNSSGPDLRTISGVVITTEGHSVIGRDPRTGDVRWKYQRDLELCGITSLSTSIYAVYRDRRGCSEVTELRASDGQRITSRSSEVDEHVTLSSDGRHMLALGRTRLELWRSDLVRTLEYGRVDAPVNPGNQPNSDCILRSAALTVGHLAVIETCPADGGDRFSIMVPSPKDNDEPEIEATIVFPPQRPGTTQRNRVLGGYNDNVLVYEPARGDSPNQLVVYNAAAEEVGNYPLGGPLPDDSILRFVGSEFILWNSAGITALRAADFKPMWTFPTALGVGVRWGDRLIVPVNDGFAVLAPATGQVLDRVAFDRSASPAKPTNDGPIGLAVIGTTLFEQRGEILVAITGNP